MRRLLANVAILIALGIGFTLGAIVCALYGRTSDAPNWITAIATVALTLFALIQLLRIESDATDVRNQRQHRLEALATLARRSCQAAVEIRGYYSGAAEWAASAVKGFDTLEVHFLEIRNVASGLGGTYVQPAREAFEAFIAAADRVNLLSDPRARSTTADSQEMQSKAIELLEKASVALETLAPKTIDEASFPPGHAKMMEQYGLP
jgi:hypothetical protein